MTLKGCKENGVGTFSKSLRVKRIVDLVLVIASMIVWVPILLVLAFLVRACIGRPVLFRQRRSGLDGFPFELVKLRSMSNTVDESGALLSDELRLGKFGKWLRSTSLDELPELYNVLKGEMSLVGPRPLLTRYLDRYSDRQAKRLTILPGLTGWAQINGRNAISWEERFELDVFYVENRSFFLDLKILWATIFQIFRRRGIMSKTSVTMEEFLGSRD